MRRSVFNYLPMEFIFFLTLLIAVQLSFLSKASARGKKVQEVNFSEMSLKGSVRNPDGAYLVQKRGLKFMPLIEVKKDMDKKIRESSFFNK